MKKFWLVLVLLLVVTGCTKLNSVSSEEGITRFKSEDLMENQVYKLRGNWRLVLDEYVDPLVPFESVNTLGQNIELPTRWQEITYNNKSYSHEVSGSLILGLEVDDIQEDLAILSTYLTSAFEVYVNGERISANGVLETGSSNEVAKWHPVVGHFESHETNVIVIHFSNHQFKKMVIRDFMIGTYKQIEAYHQARTSIDLVTFGILFMMGCYHLILFFIRKSDRSSLVFAVMTLSYALRTILVGSRVINEFFPSLPWQLFMKLAYISFYATAGYIVIYMFQVFAKGKYNKTIRIYRLITFGAILATAVLHPNIFDTFLLPYEILLLVMLIFSLVVIIKAYKNKVDGSLITLISITIVIGSAVNDILYESGMINTTSLTPFALLLIMFSQSFVLAYRHARAYELSEKLLLENSFINEQLNEHNINLEKIVEERTTEIQAMNEELVAGNEELTDILEALNKSDQHFKSMFMNIPVGAFRYSKEKGFEMINPKMAEILGFKSFHELIEVLNNETYRMLPEEDEWNNLKDKLARESEGINNLQIEMKTKQDNIIITSISWQIVDKDGDYVACEGTLIDMTKRVELEREMEKLATTDGLTGLKNRRVFTQQLNQLDHGGSLAIVDIDDFKDINDTYGHDVGDKVLVSISNLLREKSGSKAVVSRIGGEEFGIIFQNMPFEQVTLLLDMLRSEVSELEVIHLGKTIKFNISIGVSDYKEHMTSEDIYRLADQALYNAKENGKNRISIAETRS